MTTPINPLYLRLASVLLEQASDEFSNHGCNDFAWPVWFPEDQKESFLRAMERHNNPDPSRESEVQDTIESYSGKWAPPDWWLMSFLSHVLCPEPTEHG